MIFYWKMMVFLILENDFQFQNVDLSNAPRFSSCNRWESIPY